MSWFTDQGTPMLSAPNAGVAAGPSSGAVSTLANLGTQAANGSYTPPTSGMGGLFNQIAIAGGYGPMTSPGTSGGVGSAIGAAGGGLMGGVTAAPAVLGSPLGAVGAYNQTPGMSGGYGNLASLSGQSQTTTAPNYGTGYGQSMQTAPNTMANGGQSGYAQMRAPNGEMDWVHPDHVDHYTSMGASLI